MIIKTYALTLFLAVVTIVVKAQTKLPQNIFQQKLDNGLTVMVIEGNSVPLVTVSMTFKNGGYTEAANYGDKKIHYKFNMGISGYPERHRRLCRSAA